MKPVDPRDRDEQLPAIIWPAGSVELSLDDYALGWGTQDFDGALSSVHVGSAGAFIAMTILQPTRDLGVAVFANAGGDRAKTASTDAIKALIHRFAAAGK